ncbi:FadR/GntR family transcriptional regulator [Corynebacterium pseudodiphtheriticum]|uniref:FadR/GntR family transcriptional regulator n=1 Tax=Corynebacterium pseudodiphtheriticum TaxID=37637 RepID=UPI0020C0853E|nr:FCD domain-containing protein [Corynebacterium pseudodiphtheriticum]MDK8564203.1 FCD domain-containing protein [Corynebacterium pseudodiphtheriticum]MDK8584476.1 FCD domain-containing protein [Corynebacterium pseudodiphtheriticum]MDK8840226.1 FCD domain-containing protein [Corynebacterium pseudodiphtheriticum]UQV54569.1 FCD domain-containing protein [Corynebacterium pseudodiphtheriticum]UQV56600.1 FCD domain-containing protein [Corynebacterium pseudodiphtheriticum]
MTPPHHPHGATATAPLLGSVFDELGREIVSGEHPAGTQFTLHAISERFGISRTVARETMRALEHVGLVAAGRRVGITVLEQRHWALFDPAVISWRLAAPTQRTAQLASLNELRMAVEPVAARQAAYNASPQQRAEILELASTLVHLAKMPAEAGRQEDDAADFLATDLRFHSLLLEASGNEMFAALVPVFFAIHSGKTVFGVGADKPVANTLDLHQELAQYVSDGDGIHAERTSHALLHEVARSLE